MRDGDAFSKLIDEFGTMEKKEKKGEKKEGEGEVELDAGKDKKKKDNVVAAKLMQDEERETGTVSWSVYSVSPRAQPHPSC